MVFKVCICFTAAPLQHWKQWIGLKLINLRSPNHLGEQGWRSGESARLSPMCPGFNSRTRRHMWIEFVVGSRPCSEGFSPGSPVFLPPQKPTFLNSNSIGNSRATGLSVEDCCVSPSLNKVDWLIDWFIYLIAANFTLPAGSLLLVFTWRQ